MARPGVRSSSRGRSRIFERRSERPQARKVTAAIVNSSEAECRSRSRKSISGTAMPKTIKPMMIRIRDTRILNHSYSD